MAKLICVLVLSTWSLLCDGQLLGEVCDPMLAPFVLSWQREHSGEGYSGGYLRQCTFVLALVTKLQFVWS
jgi:hypothetical protein